jgi:protein TonB
MKPLLITLAFLGSAIISAAQTPMRDSITRYSSFIPEDDFPGGEKAWNKFVEQHWRYPAEAITQKIKGVVVVQFTVNPDSTISDIRAISGPTTTRLREEAVSVIKASGKWIPAIENGRQVSCVKRAPFNYRLDE